jgi:choice-of-anchor C domain-containing protein
MKSRMIAALALLLLLPRPALANLVANGSFEMAPTPPGTVLLAVGSNALAPWAVSRGDVECVGATAWAPAEGSCSVALNGSTAGGVSQSFSTVPGGLYGVSFALAGDPTSGIHHVRVAAAGASQDFSFDTSAAWEWAMGWTAKSWQFTAVSNATTVELYSLDAASQAGPAIDNVDVEVVSLVDAPGPALAFALAPAAPNPASGTTLISWSLMRAGEARLAIFDVRGRQVALLASGPQSAGAHSSRWDASQAAPGVYLVQLTMEGQTRMSRVAVTR